MVSSIGRLMGREAVKIAFGWCGNGKSRILKVS
jgi:hypothetical protein